MKLSTRILLIVVLFIIGCTPSTYINVKVLKPAKVDIGDVKRIAVADFTYTGSWSFYQEQDPDTFTEIAKAALKKTFNVDKKTSAPPDPLEAYPGKKISDYFISKLVSANHFEVVEREKLEQILKEQELSLTGISDPEYAIDVGKILGVDAIIFGEGNYTVKDIGEWKQPLFDEDADEYFQISRLVDVSITYRVVTTTTGLIKASKTIEYSNYDESSIYSLYDDYIKAEDEETAMSNIPPWFPIVDKHTKKAIKRAVTQISPHYKTEERDIWGGNTKGMQRGLDYAERGMWEDAKKAWESVLASKSDEAKKEYSAAKGNLAIYYEVHGDYEEAKRLLDECYFDSGDDYYLDEKKRVLKRIKEMEELRSQGAVKE